MNGWNVTVTYRGRLEPSMAAAITHDLIDCDGLAANLPDGRFTIAVTSEFCADKATGDAIDRINAILADSGAPLSEPIAIEAMDYGEYDRRVNEPSYPELMSAGEAAETLGVTRQRVHQLVAEHSDFPEPIYELSAGKLWSADAIRGFRRRWTRKPGRRPTVPS